MKVSHLGIVLLGSASLGIIATHNVNADQIDDNNVVMQRLYNPNSGEHFYTARTAERDFLVRKGWQYEGIGWTAPKAGDPVYRLHNPNAGDHHYTVSFGEMTILVNKYGWNYEGIGWYSAKPNEGKPLYRSYNPNAKSGSHNYTLSGGEHNYLIDKGWRAEGIGWYGVNTDRHATSEINTGNDDSDSNDNAKDNTDTTNNQSQPTQPSNPKPNESDGSSPAPEGSTGIGNSGKFFEKIEDANTWANKQINDASSPYYKKVFYPTTVVKSGFPVGYSIQFNEDISNGGSNQSNTFEFNESEVASEIIRLSNQDRVELGKEKLEPNSVLMAYASVRAEEITQLYSHDRPDGSAGGGTKYIDGETYFIGGENITIVYADKASSNKELALLLFTNWKNSAGHYDNIVGDNISIIGVGIHKGTYSGKDAYYSCMDVGVLE